MVQALQREGYKVSDWMFDHMDLGPALPQSKVDPKSVPTFIRAHNKSQMYILDISHGNQYVASLFHFRFRRYLIVKDDKRAQEQHREPLRMLLDAFYGKKTPYYAQVVDKDPYWEVKKGNTRVIPHEDRYILIKTLIDDNPQGSVDHWINAPEASDAEKDRNKILRSMVNGPF